MPCKVLAAGELQVDTAALQRADPPSHAVALVCFGATTCRFTITPITEVHNMSIVVRFSPIGLTANKYDETISQLKNAGEWPPAGLDYHVCFGADGNLRVSEIWNSREQFEAFGKRLMPILAGAGIQLANPPDIFEVHNIVKG